VRFDKDLKSELCNNFTNVKIVHIAFFELAIILFFLINEGFEIRVITYFGGSFWPLRQSKALYKVGFFEEITGDLQKKPNLQHL
jgi:hypothetical protein